MSYNPKPLGSRVATSCVLPFAFPQNKMHNHLVAVDYLFHLEWSHYYHKSLMNNHRPNIHPLLSKSWKSFHFGQQVPIHVPWARNILYRNRGLLYSCKHTDSTTCTGVTLLLRLNDTECVLQMGSHMPTHIKLDNQNHLHNRLIDHLSNHIP